MDSSAGCEDHQEQSDWMSKPLPGDTSLADLIWVPGEGSSTGNVTGGRKFARHFIVARQTRSLPFLAPDSRTRVGVVAQPSFKCTHAGARGHYGRSNSA